MDGVFRRLVRYGAPGFVGWFGTIHQMDAPRGAQVVVATDRGLELGEVLVGPDEAENASAPAAGEVLRRATDEDRRLAEQRREAHMALVEQCRRRIAQRDLPIAIVDGELLLDGVHAVLYFLGEATEKLGPLAVELGEATGVFHVQFQSLEAAPGESAAEFPPAGPAPPPVIETQPAGSPQELIKSDAAARWSRLKHELHDSAVERITRDDAFLLQLHGVYRQDDRDAKRRKAAAKQDPLQAFRVGSSAPRRSFMVRTRPPGGRLTARQLLTHFELADRFGNGSVRITSRQGLQLHAVAKGHLHAVLHEINQALLTTLGACGDVTRNVMCCPAPVRHDRIRTRLNAVAADIARHFTPHCPAYYEIWLDENAPRTSGSEVEPLYGDTYLPRKCKIALALPEDNCVDIFTQDVGLLASADGERLRGFQVLVGGGLGASPKREDTFARLAEPLAFVRAGDELRLIDAIVQIHRKYGNRHDRRRARLKYLVEEWGIGKFKATLEEWLNGELAPPGPIAVSGCDDHLGWLPQGDGRYFLGIPVASGRIDDAPGIRLKSALRTVLERFAPPVRLTPQQNLILCDLTAEARAEVEGVLQDAGAPLVEKLSLVRRYGMACPALPTCGLALGEAERVAPQLLAAIEQECLRLGLADQPLAVRIAGCLNGCSRTATADIAFVARSRERYAIYVGGGLLGTRLNRLYKDDVHEQLLVAEIAALLQNYRVRRLDGEHLADFLARTSELPKT